MTELEEFADALLDQISVETNEEKDIARLSSRIAEDPEFKVKFETPEQTVRQLIPELRQKIFEFTGIAVPEHVRIEFPGLEELKKIKGCKVFARQESRNFIDGLFAALAKEDRQQIVSVIKEDIAKFLVYSTYAKSYISKISTTYGDYLDGTVYLNNFVLTSYPQIILYKQGRPFEARYDSVKSGYIGALKMTALEELVHSIQSNLYEENKAAVIEVNKINEELAGIILSLDDATVAKLSEYLQLPQVPDEFPIAKRANLFFMLNPDNFIVNVLGPDVMTFTKVEIDPGISQMVPQLLGIYQRWLGPIQKHHAVFSTMEGMAEFCVQNILREDSDFHQYLTMFMGTDISSYTVRKHMGKDLVSAVYSSRGKDAFSIMIKNPPTTRELKDHQRYLSRI
ncbi:hypothetical protein [Candidatus Nitrosotenuis uzonensis]|uniref:Uncharacterized protein n=1 Tax=Candidatus Nitrosotenuis uzonensis TaxID=1407055 RepID=A0A812EZH8_9ARCH|nr:hypothetical protein [Candidatus Nitrosotenuis uzonensis]CAE6495922.1 conserved hypothetical protein [Candidatus Nitrosotenuis uzonensis]